MAFIPESRTASSRTSCSIVPESSTFGWCLSRGSLRPRHPIGSHCLLAEDSKCPTFAEDVQQHNRFFGSLCVAACCKVGIFYRQVTLAHGAQISCRTTICGFASNSEIPFPLNRFDPSERKLSNPSTDLMIPKTGSGVQPVGLQPVFHLLHFRGIMAGWIRVCQEFLEFQRVTFSLHCNVGSHFIRSTLDIGLTCRPVP